MKKLQNKVDVVAPDGTNPYGSIFDDTGADDGTPLDKDLFQDAMIFFERLIDLSGIVANGNRDNSVTGFQLYEAFRKVARPYNVYSCLISQSGTGAPTAIVLENTTGVANPTFTRSGTGIYNVIFPSAVLTANKTTALISPLTAVQRSTSYSYSSTTQVQIYTGQSHVLTDSLLIKTYLEIRVYD